MLEETCAHILRISDDVFRMVSFEVCEAALDKHDDFLEARIALTHLGFTNLYPIQF